METIIKKRKNPVHSDSTNENRGIVPPVQKKRQRDQSRGGKKSKVKLDDKSRHQTHHERWSGFGRLIWRSIAAASSPLNEQKEGGQIPGRGVI